MAALKRPMEEGTPEREDEYAASGAQLMVSVSSGDLLGASALLAAGVPASFQDKLTGTSALMAAAGAGSLEVVELLLGHGAPWNALDRQSRCAGEYAVDGGHQECIDRLVRAGVQAELLFGAMERRTNSSPAAAAAASPQAYDAHSPAPPGQYVGDRGVRYDGDKLLDSADDAVMMAWETPLMEAHADVLLVNNGLADFGDLLAPLGVNLATSLGATRPGPAHASAQGSAQGSAAGAQRGPGERSVLNVGFGMGIVDRALQRRGPGHHTIIEAHPVVYEQMVKEGWTAMPNVTVVFGRWQDVIANLGPFDAVFFDTYGERYSDMSAFHETLPRLLNPGGIYSFFNGMCPFNLFFHGVACELVTTELASLGLRTVFVPLQIQLDQETWEGVKRKYWERDVYYLPVSVYVPS